MFKILFWTQQNLGSLPAGLGTCRT